MVKTWRPQHRARRGLPNPAAWLVSLAPSPPAAQQAASDVVKLFDAVPLVNVTTTDAATGRDRISGPAGSPAL